VLTEKQYIEKGGVVCPICESDHIEAGSIDIEGQHAYQSVWCRSCEAEWDDVYELRHATPTDWTDEQHSHFYSEESNDA
jgi:transposase-like protein